MGHCGGFPGPRTSVAWPPIGSRLAVRIGRHLVRKRAYAHSKGVSEGDWFRSERLWGRVAVGPRVGS